MSDQFQPGVVRSETSIDYSTNLRQEIIQIAERYAFKPALDAYSLSMYGKRTIDLNSIEVRKLYIIFLPMIISIRIQLEDRTLQ